MQEGHMRNLVVAILALLSFSALSAPLPLEKIKLPAGFQIQLHASGIGSARQMALGEKGTLFVGTSGDKVHAVTHEGKVIELATGLIRPNGVAFKDGALYVAEIHRVLRFDQIEGFLEKGGDLKRTLKPVVVFDKLPTDGHHGMRHIGFGPDGLLYLGIGAPCNVCERADERYASISRINLKKGTLEVFAKGVRNTVGFDWNPRNGELWFSDNGRDWLGDDSPPDELNVAGSAGLHFGFPYCHGTGVADPEFGNKKNCAQTRTATLPLGPHVAALGIAFYQGKAFPESYRDRVFIAEHGSWNRSEPIGYRISSVRIVNNKPMGYEIFAEGWLPVGEKSPWGRPVDVLVTRDGSLLVSDDHAGVIYRFTARR
jgi:glucose/arabinose dehydrogenase